MQEKLEIRFRVFIVTNAYNLFYVYCTFLGRTEYILKTRMTTYIKAKLLNGRTNKNKIVSKFVVKLL